MSVNCLVDELPSKCMSVTCLVGELSIAVLTWGRLLFWVNKEWESDITAIFATVLLPTAQTIGKITSKAATTND